MAVHWGGRGPGHMSRNTFPNSFTPLSLFSAGEQGVYYDPSDISTLFQDEAGTIPVTAAGQAVGRMLDKSGRGNHATQAVTASKPILRQSGGRYYLEFDGLDDFLVTGSINFTATDAVSIFAGIRKEDDGATAALLEFSTSASVTAGSFSIFAPGTAGAYYRFRTSGSLFGVLEQSGFASPISSVLTAYSDISADTAVLRVDGAVVASSAADLGTGTLSNSPLYVGMRAGTSFPFQGRLYGLVVLGRQATAGEINQTEVWMRGRIQNELAIIGSSIASGQVSSTYATSFAGLLGSALPHRVVSNYGVPGRNSTTLVTDFPAIMAHKPKQVIIATTLHSEGVYGTGVESEKRALIATWKNNIENCIAQAQSANCSVVLCSPPPINFNTALDVSLINELIRNTWMRSLGVTVVDLFLAGNDGTGKWMSGYEVDGVHPNDTGHAALFAAFDLGILV